MAQRDSNLLFDVVSPGSFFTVQFNVTVKPFDDLRVRQAFFYAIDRDEITTAIAPISKRSYGLNPPSFPGAFTAETIPPEVAYTYDPDKAKALLAEAGFPDNMSHYCVAMPGIDDLLNQALGEPDLEKRFEIVRQIEVQALKDAVILPVSTNGFMIVRTPKVDLGFEVVSGYVNWPLSQAKLVTS